MYRHHVGLRHPPLGKDSTELCGGAAPPTVTPDNTIFLHRPKRQVRAHGTASYDGRFFKIPFKFARKRLWLVVDPHTRLPIAFVDDDGKTLDGGHNGPINPSSTTGKAGSEEK
jgi:hypothetical protein